VGLREGFLVAGARTLTMSMWEVPAGETTEQMHEFYDRWLSTKSQAQPTLRSVPHRAVGSSAACTVGSISLRASLLLGGNNLRGRYW
jgi:hypothetical protein